MRERTATMAPITIPSRPPKRKVGIRVDGALWDEARTIAHERGEYMSEVIEAALRDYVKRGGRARR